MEVQLFFFEESQSIKSFISQSRFLSELVFLIFKLHFSIFYFHFQTTGRNLHFMVSKMEGYKIKGNLEYEKGDL
jgi:hypothetical protein